VPPPRAAPDRSYRARRSLLFGRRSPRRARRWSHRGTLRDGRERRSPPRALFSARRARTSRHRADSQALQARRPFPPRFRGPGVARRAPWLRSVRLERAASSPSRAVYAPRRGPTRFQRARRSSWVAERAPCLARRGSLRATLSPCLARRSSLRATRSSWRGRRSSRRGRPRVAGGRRCLRADGVSPPTRSARRALDPSGDPRAQRLRPSSRWRRSSPARCSR
jgi:hypothetical protein